MKSKIIAGLNKNILFIFALISIVSCQLCSAKDKSNFSLNTRWYCWPRNSEVSQCKVPVKNPEYIEFILTQGAKSGILYSYFDFNTGGNYKLHFEYNYKNLQFHNSSTSRGKVQLMFIGKDGKNGSAGIKKFPLPINNEDPGKWKKFECEFTIPDNSRRCQLAPLAISGITGKFLLKNISIRPVKNIVKIKAAQKAPVIEGILNDKCWQNVTPTASFYSFRRALPSPDKTTFLMAYDKENLYLAVKLFEENPALLKKNIASRDGKVWLDDAVEIFIAAENGKKIQLIMNSVGTCWDGELYMRVPGDPYKADSSWDGKWYGAAKINNNSWTAEFSIPFKTLQTKAQNGAKLKFNIVRDRHTTRNEISQWNRHSGALNNVAKFASLEFKDNYAILKRYTEKVVPAPLEISRTEPQFAKLSRKQNGQYTVIGMCGSFLLNYYSPGFKAKHKATWKQEQQKMMYAMHQAGMQGPAAFPWVIKILGGKDKLISIAKKFDFTFPLALHNSSHDRKAIKQGAQFYYAKTVNAADPILEKVVLEWVENFLTVNTWVKKYITFARGHDEPTNNLYNVFSIKKNPKQRRLLETLDQKIKGSFGYGKFGLFDNFAENNDEDAPFRRIAFMHWWNNEFCKAKATEHSKIKKLLPKVPYMPLVINATRSNRGIVSIPQIAEHADWLGIDPYPTSCMAAFSRERALYHTGFSVKLLQDLAPNCKTYVYTQGFKYCGKSPTPENIREWASQALKNGGEIINWYADRNREDCPEAYEEILRVSKIITSMRPLDLSAPCKTAVLYSDINTWGDFDSAQHKYYCLYTILGENLKCNFKFISDTQLDKKEKLLDKYKLLFIPALTFATKKTAEAIMDFVKNGGSAVILDPCFLKWAPDKSSLEPIRKKLVGSRISGKAKANRIITTTGTFSLPQATTLSLSKLMNCRNAGTIAAYKISLPDNADVLARYPNGSPAAFRRNFGKGVVYYFAAQPFGNSELAAAPGHWDKCFAYLLKTVNASLNNKIWDFEIPAKNK